MKNECVQNSIEILDFFSVSAIICNTRFATVFAAETTTSPITHAKPHNLLRYFHYTGRHGSEEEHHTADDEHVDGEHGVARKEPGQEEDGADGAVSAWAGNLHRAQRARGAERRADGVRGQHLPRRIGNREDGAGKVGSSDGYRGNPTRAGEIDAVSKRRSSAPGAATPEPSREPEPRCQRR